MMENFDELNTVGIKKDKAFEIAINGEKTRDFSGKYRDITVGLSSGTSVLYYPDNLPEIRLLSTACMRTEVPCRKGLPHRPSP